MRALTFALVISCASSAIAEDLPCFRKTVNDRPSVVCGEESFNILMARIIDAQAAEKKAYIDLGVIQAHNSEMQEALDECVKSIPPPPPPPPSAFRRVLPIALGIVGAGLLVGSVAIDAPTGVQVSGAVVGLAAVTTGVVLSF
jgi:hypothetical protein